MAKVVITDYKWEGKKWFFKIKTRCQECDLNTAILKNMIKKEFRGKDVKLVVKPWLDNMFEAFFKSGLIGWHAPIILINNKLFSQGTFINRKQFAKAVLEELKR